MVDELRERFNNDFKKVSAQQIAASMDNECTIQMTGFQGQICKSTVRKNACRLLKALRIGATNAQACNASALC